MRKSRRYPEGTLAAKVGTMPALIVVDRRCCMRVGRRIRFREAARGSKWQTGIVTAVDPLRIDRF